MITVIIPTHNRPEMLRVALSSVARQTAFGKIDNVIVSDNGSTDGAKQVCIDFINEYRMPLGCIIREPCSAIDHARRIWEEHRRGCQSEFTAILHDDDWWRPDHLMNALQGLRAVKDSSFYGSGHYDVFAESSLLHASGNLFAWFASCYPSINQAWIIRLSNMLIAQAMGGICHYSTMVVRTEMLKKASAIYDLPNAEFDNDRMIQTVLAILGPALFNPIPEVFIRQHEKRDCMDNFTSADRIRHFRETTAWIIKETNADPDGLIKAIAGRLDDCPNEAREAVTEALYREWCLPELGVQSDLKRRLSK